jgi:hypothetical protein
MDVAAAVLLCEWCKKMKQSEREKHQDRERERKSVCLSVCNFFFFLPAQHSAWPSPWERMTSGRQTNKMADRRVEIMAVARPNEIKYKNLTVLPPPIFSRFIILRFLRPWLFLYFISIFLLFRLAFLLSVTLLDWAFEHPLFNHASFDRKRKMDDDEEHSGDDKNQRARPPSAYTQLRNFKYCLCATKVELQFFSIFLFSPLKRHNLRFLSAIILDSRAKMSIGEMNKISCRYSYTNILHGPSLYTLQKKKTCLTSGIMYRERERAPIHICVVV